MSRESNVIYVGRKPPINYVLGIITSFSGSNAKEVTLKARGQAITTAIDAVEITRRRFMKELSIGKITIGTEEMQREEGGTIRFNHRSHVNACFPRKERGGEGERKDGVCSPHTSYKADLYRGDRG